MHFAFEISGIAIISNQSSEINPYQKFLKKYNRALSSLKNKNLNRLSYFFLPNTNPFIKLILLKVILIDSMREPY